MFYLCDTIAYSVRYLALLALDSKREL